MRERKSARLLVINPSRKVLLFRFLHKEGALAGDDYWATPGGGLEGDETFQVAAIRELHEETGIQVCAVGEPVASRRFPMQLPSGEWVTSVEQYFVVHAPDQPLSRAGWTSAEAQVMADHHWWSAEDLRATEAIVWPEALVEMLEEAGVFERSL
ncbi:ADP-ribose pyrophosphatase YjhB (NUDIX family) [Pseudomonas chlororaphis]|uniref:NUDIX hydrolase n=1 Tax=Pseudomonas chlororaphis TaxID=587753 RepID=UPI00209E616F|nr:NUDIX domain-containing protein [Pseudomonas chlororaphis]MCP1479250.1 ADP-ribose pyrophosphatase YjhB (NUDIX family) [Pseudomonas chlororaphis]MCP1594398.1 ADP-ribose pyrophosphatase YjhB (NUDIX family) [Pseudomonas chlororaphis]